MKISERIISYLTLYPRITETPLIFASILFKQRMLSTESRVKVSIVIISSLYLLLFSSGDLWLDLKYN